MAVLQYILRRALRHWHLFLTLGLGVVLATALLASAPLLVDTVTELGLRHKLQSSEVLAGSLRLHAYVSSDNVAIQERDDLVRAKVWEHMDDQVEQIVLGVSSYWMIPWVSGQPLQGERVNLRSYEGIENRVILVAGHWPVAATVQEGVFPAVISEAMAQAYDLRVGGRLPLSHEQEDQPAHGLLVSGIVRPRDPDDPYWFGELSPLRAQSDKRWTAQYGAIVSARDYTNLVTSLLPGTSSEAAWNVLLAPDKITVARIPQLRAEIAALGTDLYYLQDRILLDTAAEEFLAGFEAQAQAIRLPLYILTAEIVLLALYYVTMVATLSVQQSEREFAILRSRGASAWQTFRLQAIEAGLIGAVALFSGPGLAALMVQGITWFGPLSDVKVAGWATGLTRGSWLAAGIGAAACVAGLLLPIGPALRRSIVTQQQVLARPLQKPWWQRLYLDVFLLAAGLALLWRLHLYGGIATGNTSKVDWLLLLSPLALLLGSATILLRIFPLLLDLCARLVARGRGLPGTLALWQISRNPTRVVLLVLLLTLAMALGILSTGLNLTLDVSELERAQYTAGGDLRFVSDHLLGTPELLAEPGVRALTTAVREEGTVNLKSYRSLPSFEALAIDPSSFEAVATFRDDFSSRPMGELIAGLTLSDSLPMGISLPGQPAQLGMWLWPTPDDKRPFAEYFPPLEGENDLDRIGLVAKLRTAAGEVFTVELEPLEDVTCPFSCCNACCREGIPTLPPGARPSHCDNPRDRLCQERSAVQEERCQWRYFQAALPDLPSSSYPLEIHSIWLQNLTRTKKLTPFRAMMNLFLDDITVVDKAGRVQIAESFENPTEFWSLTSAESRAGRTKTNPHSGKASQLLQVAFPQPYDIVGLQRTRIRKEAQLPALASPAFLAATDLQVGDSASVWIGSLPAVAIRIIGSVQYFPTMYERLEAGFLVIPRDVLLAQLNDRSSKAINASEAWLATDGQVSAEQVSPYIPAINEVWDVAVMRNVIKADPMALGLRSMTFLGYLLTSILSIVGFATHFYMSARQREMVYGILRTMGLSPRQLYGSLVLEQVILILAGLGLGTLLGVLLNQIVLPGLPITLGDRPPVPPFRPHDDWAGVGRIYLVLGIAFLASLGAATALLWRARIHRILRIGEE